jgi:hypothetical protein
MESLQGTYTLLVFEYIYSYQMGKPEGKKPLGRPLRRWEDNIEMDLQEVGWGDGGIGLIDLAQYSDRWLTLVNAVMKLRVP